MHLRTRNIFLRVWLMSSVSAKTPHLLHAMIQTQSSLLDPPHPALLTRTPSLLFPSLGDVHWDPLLGAQFGRFAEQPLFTDYELHDLMEVSNSEVAPTLFQGSSARSASTFNSGEDIATTPVESKINDAQFLRMLASSRYTQEAEARLDRHEFITLIQKIPYQVHHFRSSTGKPVAMCSHSSAESMQNNQIEHFRENRKLCLSSMKQKFRRQFFLKNKEVRCSQKQNSNYFCRRREPNMLFVRYRI